jgi:hypothetical protein
MFRYGCLITQGRSLDELWGCGLSDRVPALQALVQNHSTAQSKNKRSLRDEK